MADLGEKMTDDRVDRIRSELGKMYSEAARDLQKKVNEYTKRYEAKDKEKRAAVAAGKLSEDDYKRWLKGQVFIGEQWNAKVSQMAKSLVNVEKEAVKVVNGEQVECFAEQANYFEFRIDKDHDFGMNFGLYDTHTVTRLVRDEPELLRRRYVDGVASEAWNVKTIRNCIMQGILQGESIPDIAKRMARDTASSDMKAMTRYARTAMTGAQNAGRLQAMRESKKKGIYCKKLWISALDDRTREAHIDLNGQTADVDKPFDSMLGPIMFPGDPNASDENVWNCRCALGYEYPDNADSDSMEEYEDEEEEFKDWEEDNEVEARQTDPIQAIKELIAGHNGDWSTEELINLGEKVAEQVEETLSQQKAQLEKVQNEIDELNKTLNNMRLATNYKQTSEYKAAVEKLSELIIEKKSIQSSMNAFPVLSKIRECGKVDADNISKYADFSYYKTKTKATKEATIEAMNFYPKEWLEKSANYMKTLMPHWTVGRAYYSSDNGEIRFDGKRATGIHELAHRFESVLPQIVRAEKAFYEKRTKGEKSQWLGNGYHKDEKARYDGFISHYMGKEYNGANYELVSMGFEYVFTEYDLFSRDAEMRNWILGILAGM